MAREAVGTGGERMGACAGNQRSVPIDVVELFVGADGVALFTMRLQSAGAAELAKIVSGRLFFVLS